MNFYFAVSEKMIEKFGMPEKIQSEYFSWKLGFDRFLLNTIAASPGEILNQVPKNHKPYAICCAHIDDGKMADILRIGLVGDTIKEIDVTVVDLTWIK